LLRSTFQRDVSPQCFIQPSCAEEVASILVLAERTNCQFAVRSGGHAAYIGASNIAGGITIDLRGLNELALSDDRTLTRVGPGNHWIDVYDYLGPKNLSVVGGRVSGIGVGGLTLGASDGYVSSCSKQMVLTICICRWWHLLVLQSTWIRLRRCAQLCEWATHVLFNLC
jgi:FAD/FMN-containing dehydrogenase